MAKEKNEDLKIEVGQVIDISLESMMGSTGYGWELSELTGPANLIGISVIPSSSNAIAPVTQVFHLRGVSVGEVTVSFVLTAAWKLEEPVRKVTYKITVTEAQKPTEDDLKIKGYVASPKASVRDQQSVIPPYAAQPPVPDYGIPCSDLWQRFYYGVLPQNQAAADPRLYYGVCCSPSLSAQADVRMYYGIPCASVQSDPRLYYGIPCASVPSDPRLYYGIPCVSTQNDPRLYYGVCCAPDANDCVTPPQVYKYGVLPRALYNVNSPVALYNIPPVMRYNFPDKC